MFDHHLPPVEDFPDWLAEMTSITPTDVMRLMVYRGAYVQSWPAADSKEDIQPELLHWTGTKRAFQDWILQVRRNGKLQATNKLDVLNQAAAHFRWRGKALQPGISRAQKLVWIGTGREFADWFLAAYRAGYIEASSNMNALEQAVAHFEKPGRALNARSLWQNLKNRDEY